MRRTPLLPCLPLRVAISAALLAFTPVMNAANVVQWGGDYITGYQSFNTAPPSTGAGWWTYKYTTTDAISPGGPRFYGAFNLVNGSGEGALPLTMDDGVVSRFGIASSGSGGSIDSIRVGVTADAITGPVTMQGLIFFQKDDFAGVSAGQKVDFSNEGSLSLTVSNFLGDNGQRRARLAVYALVGSEWKWYLSDTSVTSGSVLTVPDAAAASWGEYDIDADTAPFNPVPTVFDVLGASFEDIGAFGFHFTNRATKPSNADSTNATFYVTNFSVNATVIPEPGAAVLSVTGLLLLTGRRYWKMPVAK